MMLRTINLTYSRKILPVDKSYQSINLIEQYLKIERVFLSWVLHHIR
jgi:hypothetical protein